MSNAYNDIAILITQKIALDLQRFKQVSMDDYRADLAINRDYISGSFYEVRQSILQSVSDLVRVFNIEHATSPEQLERMSSDMVNEFQKYTDRQNIVKISEAIYEEKVFSVDTFQPDQAWGWMRRDTYSVGIIDLGKVQKLFPRK